MALLTKAIRGTQDVLPDESYKWRHTERVISDICRTFGFKEIRTPVFEHTELFQRSVGDTTDVVQKEMYTFNDKGNRSITLRPEGTAGVARSVLEHGLYNGALPLKTFYFSSCYRYEKPQAGRLREFHQFGIEMFGAGDACADAEVIAIGHNILTTLGVENLSLQINSIGCPVCRREYHKALHEYFSSHEEELCETCRGRLDRNPMRILDCKSPICHGIAEKAPVILDFLCDDCKKHFDDVKGYLDEIGISYTINPTIVRGLDYYTRTVFEFVCSDLGAQSTVCGGGRYDGLIKELGGPQLAGIGFGMGLERLMLILDNQKIEIPNNEQCDIYIATMGDNARRKAFGLVNQFRDEGFYAECDLAGRSLKAQMKYADKIGAMFSIVIGDNELETGKVNLKNMKDGTVTEVELGDKLIEAVYRHRIDLEFAGITGDFTDPVADFSTFASAFGSLNDAE